MEMAETSQWIMAVVQERAFKRVRVELYRLFPYPGSIIIYIKHSCIAIKLSGFNKDLLGKLTNILKIIYNTKQIFKRQPQIKMGFNFSERREALHTHLKAGRERAEAS